MMQTEAVFGENDTDLTELNTTIVVKTVAGGVPVNTDGWSMIPIQRGAYWVTVPNCVVRSSISIQKNGDPSVFYDGFIDFGVWDTPANAHLTPGSTGEYIQSIGLASNPWLAELPNGYTSPQAGFILAQLQEVFETFTATLGMLLAGTYKAGEVASPLSPLPGPNIPLYVGTNYSSVATVGEKWAALLATAGAKVFFTAKATAHTVTPAIDAECEIADPVAGVIHIHLSRTQTNIKIGDYFWQLEIRTFTDDPVPVVDEVWMMQVGKLDAKPTFKTS